MGTVVSQDSSNSVSQPLWNVDLVGKPQTSCIDFFSMPRKSDTFFSEGFAQVSQINPHVDIHLLVDMAEKAQLQDPIEI